jgi:hypothetical protein
MHHHPTKHHRTKPLVAPTGGNNIRRAISNSLTHFVFHRRAPFSHLSLASILARSRTIDVAADRIDTGKLSKCVLGIAYDIVGRADAVRVSRATLLSQSGTGSSSEDGGHESLE